MIEAVRTGQFDVGADGITINEEREAQIDFTVPFITVEQYFLVRADETRITGKDSFAADTSLLFCADPSATPGLAYDYQAMELGGGGPARGTAVRTDSVTGRCDARCACPSGSVGWERVSGPPRAARGCCSHMG